MNLFMNVCCSSTLYGLSSKPVLLSAATDWCQFSRLPKYPRGGSIIQSCGIDIEYPLQVPLHRLRHTEAVVGVLPKESFPPACQWAEKTPIAGGKDGMRVVVPIDNVFSPLPFGGPNASLLEYVFVWEINILP